MMSQAAALLDPSALAVVVIGTAIATTARSGWRNSKLAIRALFHLSRSGFDAGANRSAIARAASAIRTNGHLSAETPKPPDRACAKLVDRYLVNGSLEALRAGARAQRTKREIARARALSVFEYAGELAPIFGLVGTLFAITQLAPGGEGGAAETTMAAVATAVLSTLYGVLTAHLVYYPIARAIERRGERDESARDALLEWFEAELRGLHEIGPRDLQERLRTDLGVAV